MNVGNVIRIMEINTTKPHVKNNNVTLVICDGGPSAYWLDESLVMNNATIHRCFIQGNWTVVQFWGVGHDFLTPLLLIPFIFMAAIKKNPVSFVDGIWEVLRRIPYSLCKGK